MSKGGEGKVVCVTGASGFIASSLINLLLQNGYTVKATVRNLGGNPSKVAHLKALDGANQRLGLFEADLMEQGSFDAAVEGCHGVFHTATPIAFGDIKDPQAQMIKPAVNGTLNVLRSCLKVPSIKRVVFTSSMSTVNVTKIAMEHQHVEGIIDETWYSDPAFCEEIQGWYYLSKTLAEEAAWKFARENGIDLVVINPGLTIGRCLQPTLNVSSQAFLELILQGKCEFLCFGIGDVKDVAQAHVLAFENPSANGRYCVAAETMNVSQVFNMLRRLYPTLALPKIDDEETTAATSSSQELNKISRKKAESLLGVDFRPIEESFKDTIEFLKERNLLVIP